MITQKGDIYPNVLMVKDYNDTVYNIINYSGEQLNSATLCKGNYSIWVRLNIMSVDCMLLRFLKLNPFIHRPC